MISEDSPLAQGMVPRGLYSPARPGLSNCAASPALGQAGRPRTEVCSRLKLRTAPGLAHTSCSLTPSSTHEQPLGQRSWEDSQQGTPKHSQLWKEAAANICETHNHLDRFRRTLPSGCWRHLVQTLDFIFKPKAHFFLFQERATTIFNGPLALQSEVRVVLISLDGEQIYLTNYLRYYLMLLQKKSQHPAEKFTPSPFHTKCIIGHQNKKNPTSPWNFKFQSPQKCPMDVFSWRCIWKGPCSKANLSR